LKHSLSAAEAALLAAVAVALVAAILGPNVAQYARYHVFADQRALWGLPFAMDVLSNLPFAVMGAWGLARLQVMPRGTQRTLSSVFFVGLLVTTICCTWYHLRPDDAGLALDRLGMVLAFAGVTGLAVADRLSLRAGACMAIGVAVLGPVAVGVWASTANLLPWSILQGGGMLLVVTMAARRPIAGAWGVPLGALIAWYALAKLLELGDQSVFELTHGIVSGHSLKHVAAALAAWPLIALMHNGGQALSGQTNMANA
jgi:hypothetical protein